VFVVTFATQEMLIFRNAKTREIMVGAENRVEQCHYAAVVTRIEEELDNELTGGWKVVEVRVHQFALRLTMLICMHLVDGAQVSPCIPVNGPPKSNHENYILWTCLYCYHHSFVLLSSTYPHHLIAQFMCITHR
jgi:hypothetical protein